MNRNSVWRVLVLAALGAPGRCQEGKREALVFRARLHDPRPLIEEPRVTALLEAVRQEVLLALSEQEKQQLPVLSAKVLELWQSLRWPAEICVSVDASLTVCVALRFPAGTQSLVPLLTFPGALVAESRERLSFRGSSFTDTVLAPVRGKAGGTAPLTGRARLIEGDLDDRHLLILGSAEQRALPALELGQRLLERPAPVGLGERAARGIEGVVDFGAFFDVLPAGKGGKAGPDARGVFGLLFGPRFTTLSFAAHVEAGRIVQEVFADFRPRTGVLGGLVRKEPRIPALTSWIPETAEEFFVIDLEARGVRNLCKTLASLGVPMDPGSWFEGGEDLDIDLPDLVDEHLTGEIACVAKWSTVENALDPESDEPMVLLLGSPDGEKSLAELVAAIKEAEVKVEKVPGAEGILEIESDVRVAARKTFVAMTTGVDAASLQMLRACLATEGRGRLPRGFVERLGKEASEPFTAIGLSHALSSLSGRVALRDLASRPMNAKGIEVVARCLQKAFGGEKGVGAFRAVVDAKGARLRSVY